MSSTRRAFIGIGLGGATLLALGGVGLALQPTVMRTPTTPLRALSPTAFSVLAAVSDRICPAGDRRPSASDLGIAEAIDATLATSPPAIAAELEQALLLLENGLAGLLLDGRWRTFTASAPEDQDAVLRAWQHSSIAVRRQAHKGLRTLVAAAYFAHPSTAFFVGYPGAPDFGAIRRAQAAAAQADAAQAAAAGQASP